MIEQVLKFASTYEPRHAASIRGVPRSEITELEHLIKHSLPSPYVEFLERMGRGLGAMDIEDANFTIDLVRRFYERRKDQPASPFIFMGVRKSEPPVSYYIDSREKDESRQPIVLVNSGSEATDAASWPLFPSLQEMLYVYTFDSLRLRRLPYQRSLSSSFIRGEDGEMPGPATSLEEVELLVLKMGFQRLPRTSDLNPLFDRKDSAILGHQNMLGGGFTLEFAGDDEHVVTTLSEILSDNLPLE